MSKDETHSDIRVIRGGYWYYILRAERRFNYDPDVRFDMLGFRLAEEVTDE